MNNPFLVFSFKSALVASCFLVSLQGCAVEAAKTTDATQKAEAPAQASATQDNSIQDNATQTVFKVVTKGVPAYLINDQQNPEITLKRGITYTFELKATGHPFWIKSKNSTGKTNAYDNGVIGNGTERGTLTFAVPKDAPALLHYNCEVHDIMNNIIHVIN